MKEQRQKQDQLHGQPLERISSDEHENANENVEHGDSGQKSFEPQGGPTMREQYAWQQE